MSSITLFLWFDDKAEEAMHFYISIFPNSKVLSVSPGPNGTAMSVYRPCASRSWGSGRLLPH